MALLLTYASGEAFYDQFERIGVTIIVAAALVSLSSILYLLSGGRQRTNVFRNTHILSYYGCLLFANVIQSIGTVLNLRWVVGGAVEPGQFCSAQGGIKQAGNVATGLWSMMISVHLFNLLFLRVPSTKLGRFATMTLVWGFVLTVVLIGPLSIQTAERGPYFSVAGYWCWITDNYPREQDYLEYFLEFFSAGIGFLLYTAILLRMRGNLIFSDGKWGLRFVPQGESWQLAIGRDLIDSSMLRIARNMVWFPVAYTLLILPIGLSRLLSYNGVKVPFGVVFVMDSVFNLTGFVNVLLLVRARRLIPEEGSLPEFTTPRKQINTSTSEAMGITPFTVPLSETIERPQRTRTRTRPNSQVSVESGVSLAVPMEPLSILP